MIARACALAIPAALLATGCAATDELDRPPEVPVAGDGTTATVGDHGARAGLGVYVPSFGEVSARWLLPPTSPWAPYEKTTLLAALDDNGHVQSLPQIENIEGVADAREAANAVAVAGLPRDAMWVVDLPGAASVAFGAALSAGAREPVAPVLTFHNWPAQNELVPAEETLAALVALEPRLPSGAEGAPVFLLDAWRLALPDEPPDDEVTDNRYMLTPADLPAPEVLLSRGIRRVLYVVEDLEASDREEDDLHAAFAAYQAAGISIAMVDLALLQDRPEIAPWDDLGSDQWSLLIDPARGTVVTDPSFYARARGGFGGPHVIHGGGHGFGFGHFFGHGGG